MALPFEHFKLYPENKATKKTFSKINITHEREIILKKTVVLSDLDIVNHVNNVKYLEWCLDCVDEALILNQKITSLDMNFLKELSFKDEIIIHENLVEKELIFSITKQDKICFALQLNIK